MFKLFNYSLIILLLLSIQGNSQITDVGNGSYTNTFPGTDAAGRNTYPSGSPQISGNAVGKPVPTNDWWSSLIKNDHASNIFNYPMALKTINAGLVVSYIPWGVWDAYDPIIVGTSSLNASKATISDFSDWTVTMDWNDGTHNFQTTSGIAMPFLYFNKSSSDLAQITVNTGTVTVSNEMLIVENAHYNADFVFYAPAGSTWNQSGSTYTSNLNGQNYWSMAMIPLTASNVLTVADEYKKYAYVFPVNTTTDWNFDETTSKLTTTFTVTTDVKEGVETNMLLGLLPHQRANLAPSSPQPDKYSYNSVRGEIKTLDGNTFSVQNTFKGILPTLPYVSNYSQGFSPVNLNSKIKGIENDGLASWTDSYNEGQVMNRLIQTARIADQTGNIEALNKIIATVKERLEDWLKAEAGEVAFLFYYNLDWTAMIGYPAGHGQDGNLNDHHFHWGYFIHAAAFMEQYEPGWSDQWGDMINLLVRDAASSDRNDTMFPFLRNFSPYAGHCWANGFATFPQGNDQESTSESMQFNSSLIHWGTVTGNNEIRDLGIYLYTTEQTAVEEYWFDMYERNFSQSQQYSLVSRVWGNSYDNGTFWTSDIAASYGIELYPIHGGSLYLGHDTTYVRKLWNEIAANTGILSNEANPNLWHDVMWEYLSFIEPETAISLYDSYPDRSLKFGISDAQTYYWLHNMNVLGSVDNNITADHTIAAAFSDKQDTIYVAHNYTDAPISVTFSSGFELPVPANETATSLDIDVSGVISSDFSQAYANGTVNLTVEVTGIGISKVDFYDGNSLIGTITEAPYMLKTQPLSLGVHGFYAKVYKGSNFNITNIIDVQVGEQVPYLGSDLIIPGTIQAGHYDKFEGGIGQGISYTDVSQNNEGDFRPEEYVDAVSDATEGATVGWISAGEWLEYSIDVQTAGNYDLSFRYASGNSSGGGPFYFEIDGQRISADISVAYTGDWDAWTDKTVNNIELTEGIHILRLLVTNGEFNLGRMTFTYESALGYFPPTANAGSNVKVILPETTATLDGSLSSDPEAEPLTYLWEQVYGPSIITFNDNTLVSPSISNLEEGIYKCRLTVSDGTYSDTDDVMILVSSTANYEPAVTVTSPVNNAEFYMGSEITINASASDLDGYIVLVEFFEGETKIGESTNEPYNIVWTATETGTYTITAKVTDDGGATVISSPVTVIINPAPSCSGGPDNGDYTYRFSDAKDKPTLTFIPSASHVGNPTCILYYSTSTSGPFPGYGVTPNNPFQINASEGTKIYFYYTYSYNGLERNTSANMHSYVIGTCQSTGIEPEISSGSSILIYPNPVSNELKLKNVHSGDEILIYDLNGKLLIKTISSSSIEKINVNRLLSGVYFIKIIGDKYIDNKKFIKK